MQPLKMHLKSPLIAIRSIIHHNKQRRFLRMLRNENIRYVNRCSCWDCAQSTNPWASIYRWKIFLLRMPIVYPPKGINKQKQKKKQTERMNSKWADGRVHWRVKHVHVCDIYSTYCRMIHVSLLPGATLCENGRQKKDGFVRKWQTVVVKQKINKLSKKISASGCSRFWALVLDECLSY